MTPLATKHECTAAIEHLGDDLARLPYVAGLGILPADGPDEFVVAVYVERKVPEDELPPGGVVPKVLRLQDQGRLLEVPTRVVETGVFKLENF